LASVALAPASTRGRLLAPVAREEWARLANWLLVWVVIANAGFALMWVIGAPPRGPEIVIAGVVGLVVRRWARWIRIAAFCAITIASLMSFIAGLFNLSPLSLMHALRFFVQLDPAQSIEYLIGAGVVAALIGLAGIAMRRPQGFADLRLVVIAIMAVALLALLDRSVGLEMRGHYKRTAMAGAPFTSAVGLSGFGEPVAGAPRHLMVVMVESLGEPAGNAEMARLMFARYRAPEVTLRFDVERGTTTYYNSTTAGEVRELCGRWGDYYELLGRRDEGCLPARLRQRGFETSAYHSFTGEFFERATWYPSIGFDNRVFGDALVAQGLRECGGVFPGACDRDVPHVLAARLRRAERPQFVYWLTLNSHLPVPPGRNLDVEHCERISAGLAARHPMICRQFAIWDAVDAALVEEITAPGFPPTDILIVGDHMPPYFDRHSRSQFAPDRVPWLMLRWKGDRAGAVQGTAAATGAAPTAKG
jgi:hypothetical protein